MISWASCTTRLDRPPAAMISPAKTKKGMAINGKLSAPSSIWLGMVMTSQLPEASMSVRAHSVSTREMGMPRARKMNRLAKKYTSCSMAHLWLRSSSRAGAPTFFIRLAGVFSSLTKSRPLMTKAAAAMMGRLA